MPEGFDYSAYGYEDIPYGADEARLQKIWDGLIERGLSEDKASGIISRMLEESGADIYREDSTGKGLLNGIDWSDNMFVEDDDYYLDQQLDSVVDGINADRIDISVPFEETKYGAAVKYRFGGKMYADGGWVIPDEDELARRQAWAESLFNAKARSPRGAMGIFQIMPDTLSEYQTATGDKGDIYDAAYNRKVRDWQMGRLGNSRTIYNGDPSDAVRLAKLYAAYNWGQGNLGNYLQKLKDNGEDIYQTLDWVDGLPEETRNYVNFILNGQDTGAHRTNKLYGKAVKTFEPGGDLYGDGEGERKIAYQVHKGLGFSSDVEKTTHGAITKEGVHKFYTNPKDWATLLFSPEQIKDIRQNLYNNAYPFGYSTRKLKSMADVAFSDGDEIGSQHKDYDVAVALDLPSFTGGMGSFAMPSVRDEAWGHYLQPEHLRDRLHTYLVPTDKVPKSGATYDRTFSFDRSNNKNFDRNLVESYNSAIRGDSYHPVRNDGSIDGSYRVFNKGKTPGYYTVDSRGYGLYPSALGTPEDVLGGTYTISSGVDPNKGQYVSYYDDYDLNPALGSRSAGQGSLFIKPIKTPDASGGIGNPFSIYDRVYLDDYYGVSSKPEEDSFYGGYIVPSIVTALK